jgi:hypothetical protein
MGAILPYSPCGASTPQDRIEHLGGTRQQHPQHARFKNEEGEYEHRRQGLISHRSGAHRRVLGWQRGR